jgi:hypothetical protein
VATGLRLLPVEPGRQHRELVAAEARKDVSRAQQRPEPRPHRAEQVIAHGVPEGVVDLFEVV